jgi:hypothetical protein
VLETERVPGQLDRLGYALLVPLTHTADGSRIVALGAQLTVTTYDAATGRLIERAQPPFDDDEGAVRVSADGLRVVVYRLLADTLVVIDRANGVHRGYLCPRVCNRYHQPVEVPYAVSPNGPPARGRPVGHRRGHTDGAVDRPGAVTASRRSLAGPSRLVYNIACHNRNAGCHRGAAIEAFSSIKPFGTRSFPIEWRPGRPSSRPGWPSNWG